MAMATTTAGTTDEKNGRQITRVCRDASSLIVFAELSNGSTERAECFNCSSPNLSIVFLYLNATSSTPVIPDEVAFKRFTWESDGNEYIGGVCWDRECIEFSTAVVSLKLKRNDVLDVNSLD